MMTHKLHCKNEAILNRSVSIHNSYRLNVYTLRRFTILRAFSLLMKLQ